MSYTITDSITFMFKADTLGVLFAVLFSCIFVLVGIAGVEYMKHEGGAGRLYALFVPTGLVMVLACFAGNFFTYYVLFELMTFISMPMVLHDRSHESIMAALKYLFYSVGGAFLTLFGFFLFMSKGYDLTFRAGGSMTGAPLDERELFAVFLMILGFGTKAGMFPMHGWLPTAHPVAPAPASAVLSGTITKAGVLGIIRCIFYVVGPDGIRGTWVQMTWIILAMITVFMGSMMAYQEKIFKKRLAYSTVSQVSYVMFGLSLLDPTAFVGAVMHVIFHSIVKDTLFLNAGAVIMKSGRKKVKELDGIGRKMPVTMWCYTLVSITLIGIPPTSAFVSKWYLGVGALKSKIPVIRWLGVAVLLVSALLTAGYLLTVSLHAFFSEEPAPAGSGDGHKRDGDAADATPDHKTSGESAHAEITDPGPGMLVPMVILTIMAVILGIIPGGLIDVISAIAKSLF